jgi:hypothetical protein
MVAYISYSVIGNDYWECNCSLALTIGICEEQSTLIPTSTLHSKSDFGDREVSSSPFDKSDYIRMRIYSKNKLTKASNSYTRSRQGVPTRRGRSCRTGLRLSWFLRFLSVFFSFFSKNCKILKCTENAVDVPIFHLDTWNYDHSKAQKVQRKMRLYINFQPWHLQLGPLESKENTSSFTEID